MKLARLFAVPLVVGILASAVLAQTFPITDFEAFPAPSSNGSVMFRQPSFSGSTQSYIDTAVNTTQVVTDVAYSGTKSLRVNWRFLPNPARRMASPDHLPNVQSSQPRH